MASRSLDRKRSACFRRLRLSACARFAIPRTSVSTAAASVWRTVSAGDAPALHQFQHADVQRRRKRFNQTDIRQPGTSLPFADRLVGHMQPGGKLRLRHVPLPAYRGDQSAGFCCVHDIILLWGKVYRIRRIGATNAGFRRYPRHSTVRRHAVKRQNAGNRLSLKYFM